MRVLVQNHRRIGWALYILGFSSLNMLILSPSSYGQDAFTANSTDISNSNHALMRGFDPAAITNFNDPFPDTSTPCCGLENSTQFGNGVPSGSSSSMIDQQRNASLGGSGFPQTSRGSILSGPGAVLGSV